VFGTAGSVCLRRRPGRELSPGDLDTLGLGQSGGPPADRVDGLHQVEQDRKQFSVGARAQPGLLYVREEFRDAFVAECRDDSGRGQASPAQFVELVGQGVLEEHPAPVPRFAVHDPPGPVLPAAARSLAPVGVQCGAVVVQAADLDSAPRVDPFDRVPRQDLVVRVRGGDLHGEAALGESRRDQRVRAVLPAGIPVRGVLAQAPVLPAGFTDRCCQDYLSDLH
jgi:hypothetical protein